MARYTRMTLSGREELGLRLSWGWSYRQIARRLPLVFARDQSMRLSHDDLYTYLYVLPRGALRRELLGYLRKRRAAAGRVGVGNS